MAAMYLAAIFVEGTMIPASIQKIYKRFCAVETTLAAICLGSTVVIITVSALSRTFGYPINFALDIALLLFTWSVFLGADTALRADKMVNVDVLFKRLPPKAQKVMQLIIYLIIMAFLWMFIILGFKLSYLTRFRVFQGIPTLSYTWVTLSVPICSVFMVITVCIKIVRLFKPAAKADTENKAQTAVVEEGV